MLEYGEESEPLEVLASTLPSIVDKPQLSSDENSVTITWQPPSNQGGGDVKVQSYSI